MATGEFGDTGRDLLGKMLFSLSLTLGRGGTVEVMFSHTVNTSFETEHPTKSGTPAFMSGHLVERQHMHDAQLTLGCDE